MKPTTQHSAKHTTPTHTAHTARAGTPASVNVATNDSTNADAFFADETDLIHEARAQALEVIARLLIWIAEAGDTQGRGLRATIALHCVRPDLIGGITLEKIGDDAGLCKQAAHKLAHDFRLGMGLITTKP